MSLMVNFLVGFHVSSSIESYRNHFHQYAAADMES